MGCWSETCAISNLPIRYHEEAVLLYLMPFAPDPGMSRLCYSNERFIPATFPIYGKHDSYGLLEYDESPENRLGILSVESLRDHLKYEPTKEGFQRDCERGEVVDPSTQSVVVPVLILREVWDFVTAHPSEDVAEGVKQLGDFVAALEEKPDSPDPSMVRTGFYNPLYFRRGEPGLGRYFIDPQDHLFGQYDLLDQWLASEIPAEDLSSEVCKVIALSRFMRLNRRAWHVPSGAGSQGENYEGAIAFYESILEIARNKLDARNRECEE